MRLRNKLIITTSIIGACALATGLFYYHQKAHEVPLPKVTFDAQGGELELYDKEKVGIPFAKGESWSTFYQDNKFIGSTKDGYDFLYWSLDGENPIPNDYVLNEPVTLKPVYVENRDCVTISCRYFDLKDEDVSVQLEWYNNLNPDASILYSYNGGQFIRYESYKPIKFADQSCYVSFRGTGEVSCYFSLSSNNSRFAVSGDVSALCGHEDLWEEAFVGLFNNNNALVSASGLKLSATTLANGCYINMFSGCTSLVIAPKVLPATTLAVNCYWNMFVDCSSLLKAPELPATTLADYCYQNMFCNCTSLVTTPELPATTLTDSCYMTMFAGCSSLVTAPELPATTLARECYLKMFQGCTSLKSIKIGYTGNFANDQNYFENWVSGVSLTGDFYYNGEDTKRGFDAIPDGWTVHQF